MPTPPVTTLSPVYVYGYADEQSINYGYDTGGFPDPLFGEFSYFYDYYVWRNGSMYYKDLQAHINLQNGYAPYYLQQMATLDVYAEENDANAWDAWFGIQKSNVNLLTTSTFEFSGTVFTPGRALWQYQHGNGQAMTMDVNKVDIMLPASLIRNQGDHSDSLLNKVATLGVGQHQISIQNISYNTYAHASLGLAFGHINVDLNGTLEIRGDGSYVVDGAFTVQPDVYDGIDPSQSHRGPITEYLTTYITGGTPYITTFTGSKPIYFDSADTVNNWFPPTGGTAIYPTSLPNPVHHIYGSAAQYDYLTIYELVGKTVLLRASADEVIIYKNNEVIHAHDFEEIAFEDDVFLPEGMDIIGAPLTQASGVETAWLAA